MRQTEEDVDAFIAASADPEALAHLDSLIRDGLPGARRSLWRGVFWGGTEQAIIGYGDTVQQRPNGDPVQWFLVGLALQKRHLSLYVNAAEEGSYLSKLYAERLGKVKVGAAAITFRTAADLDPTGLAEMLARAAKQLPGT